MGEFQIINKRIKKLTIWSIVNTFFVVLIIFLIIVNIKPYDMSEATFIGTMISSMGVLFTVIASYQIYNIIELNHRFKQVDETEQKMNSMLIQFEQRVGNMDEVMHKVYAYGLTTRALSAMTNNNNKDAALLMMEGILEYLDVHNLRDVIDELNMAINNLHTIFLNLQQVNNKWKNEANIAITKIREHSNYRFISNQFKQIKCFDV